MNGEDMFQAWSPIFFSIASPCIHLYIKQLPYCTTCYWPVPGSFQVLTSPGVFPAITVKQTGPQLLGSSCPLLLKRVATFALCPSAGISPVPHKFTNGQDNWLPEYPRIKLFGDSWLGNITLIYTLSSLFCPRLKLSSLCLLLIVVTTDAFGEEPKQGVSTGASLRNSRALRAAAGPLFPARYKTVMGECWNHI